MVLIRTSLVLLLIVFANTSSVYGAEEMKLKISIPKGMLDRVFQLRAPDQVKPDGDYKFGTCFAVEVDSRQYIITARHVVPHVKRNDKKVQIFKNNSWEEISVKPIFPTNTSVDIVALAPSRLILSPEITLTLDMSGIILAQEVYFLGYPYGLATKDDSRQNPVNIAFIKKAILSAMDTTKGAGCILYLDGHNNKGFSGGPVIFANYSKRKRLQIAGVISGFLDWPREVLETEIKDQQTTSNETKKVVLRYVMENTGIIKAYGVSEILEAIRKNPIGPLVPNQ